jgi:large subunit ribosomal protein L29
MKQEEIKQLSTADLHDKIKEEEGTLKKLKMSHKVSPIENPLKIRIYRRTIARLNTELRRRELAEQLKQN